jgi:hypothetical protein
MSAALTVGAIGTGFSIYSGIQSGNQSKSERNAAQQQLQQNQAIANELKTEEAPAQAAINQQVGQLSSQNLTPGALMAEGQLKQQMANNSRNITANAAMTGEGVAGSRQLSDQFAQAQGIAGINLQDQVNKNAQLGGWIDRATAEPTWARVATGANSQAAGFDESIANQDRSASQSAYGQAAQGLSNLARMYNTPPSTPNYNAPSLYGGNTATAPSGEMPTIPQDDSATLQNMQMNPQQPNYAQRLPMFN